MPLGRRSFLGLLTVPGIAAVGHDPAARVLAVNGSVQGSRDRDLDPQIQRLRALQLDESVEPPLVFRPASEEP